MRIDVYCASTMSFSETLSCHSVICLSGLDGRASRGSMLGNGSPSFGLMISNRFTAS